MQTNGRAEGYMEESGAPRHPETKDMAQAKEIQKQTVQAKDMVQAKVSDTWESHDR